MSLSSGASSGPCALPVNATRSGMNKSAPLRPVRSFKILREHVSGRNWLRRRHAAAAAKNSAPAAAMTCCSSAPNGAKIAPHHRPPRGRIGGQHHVVAHQIDEFRIASSAPNQARTSAVDMRCQGFLLPVQQAATHRSAPARGRDAAGGNARASRRAAASRSTIGGVAETKQLIEDRGAQKAALREIPAHWCCRAASTAARHPRPPIARHARSPAGAAPAHPAAAAGAAYWS